MGSSNATGSNLNHHSGDVGLLSWIAANHSIVNTDIVLWYTVGMHHVVPAEDWFSMPAVYHEFELQPSYFFQL
ncbi:MAG: hypothetical protein ACR2QB_08805 [Gammaproteobacteria bacterium]